MTNPDPYRSLAASQTTAGAMPAGAPAGPCAGAPGSGPQSAAVRGEDGRLTRPLLWLLLVISAVANAVTSSIGGISVFIGIGFGLATLACATALVVHHRRHRRS